MVDLGLEPFFPEVAKIVGTQGYLKSNPKVRKTFEQKIPKKDPFFIIKCCLDVKYIGKTLFQHSKKSDE